MNCSSCGLMSTCVNTQGSYSCDYVLPVASCGGSGLFLFAILLLMIFTVCWCKRRIDSDLRDIGIGTKTPIIFFSNPAIVVQPISDSNPSQISYPQLPPLPAREEFPQDVSGGYQYMTQNWSTGNGYSHQKFMNGNQVVVHTMSNSGNRFGQMEMQNLHYDRK